MEQNRDLLIDKTKKEDERSDLKQHADKMLRDFEKFNEHSSNRAIWELVQNACDLTKDCKIVIDYRDNKISFSHNGKAFTSKSLISLIKQVSGKYGDQEDISEVGKYGTGFLTTHTFGRKFIINSVLDAGGFYLPINNFKIDRSPKEWEALSDNISDQKKRVFRILNNESAVEVDALKTTFTYLPESEREFTYIDKSLRGLDDYIPLVFTINDRLKEVEVIEKEGKVTHYRYINKTKLENDKGIDLYQTLVLRNDEEFHLFSLIDAENEIEIILPINKDKEVYEFNGQIARLFFYYPLIGSEDFGINFIINCKQFLPTEPRDGIHLKSEKDQVQDQEEANRKIIDKCSELIFEFLRSNVIEAKNPLLYTNVNFKTDSDNQFLNEYFEDVQSTWNDNLKALPFVKTVEGFKPIEEAIYLSEDFLNQEEKIFDCFYELISMFYSNIPVKEDAITWSKHANNWNNDSIEFIEHEDLLKSISDCKLEDFSKQTLITYYQYLLDKDYGQVFNDFELLPNTEGNFNKLSYLVKAKNLNTQLIKLGTVLIPESITKLIYPDFVFDFPLSPYQRRDFSDDVKNELEKKELTNSIFFSDDFNDENYHTDLLETTDKIEESYFKGLLDFCKMVNNTESSSKPNLLLKKISGYYGYDENLIHLPNVNEETENIEFRSIRKVLVQVFCNLISLHNNSWVKNNLEFLHVLCSLNDDSYKEVFKESKIYPNQLYELHLSETLKRDLGVEEYVKGVYLKVKKDDINEVLSLEDFNQFIPEENHINNRYLTTIIEDILFEDDVINIDAHPHEETILDIIPKLTERGYQNLFPQLNDKKATIMISVVSNEEKKEDIFSIINLKTEKLKRIGELVKNSNFEDLLDKAENLALQELHKRTDFQHKYQIGTNIERLIREKLTEELQNRISFNNDETVETSDIQGGQDIIIFLDSNPIYYIEVKSRWSTESSVSMSKLQLQRAVEENDKYTLCSVDISKYNGINNKYELTIDEILPLTKFVNEIGFDIKPLIEQNLIAEKTDEESIHLIDYRGIIPQEVIKEGKDYYQFIDSLLRDINNITRQHA